MEGMSGVIFLVVFFVIFIFITILPQRNAQKKYAAMLQAIKAGDRVVTVARIIGVVVEVDGENVIVDLGAYGDRCRVKMHLEGIARNLTAEETTAENSKSDDKDKEAKS